MTLLLLAVAQGLLYTLSLPRLLPHTHTITPALFPPVASCPADTHTQITLHANWPTRPLTNSCLMSRSSPLQGRVFLSLHNHVMGRMRNQDATQGSKGHIGYV